MLNTHIARYVSLYRGLGRKFSEQERLLRQYAAFAERFGDRHTRVQRIYDWCHTASSQNVARHRYDAARNFSLSLTPRTQTTKSRLSAFSAGEAATSHSDHHRTGPGAGDHGGGIERSAPWHD